MLAFCHDDTDAICWRGGTVRRRAMAADNFAGWVTKLEAAEQLHVSERTLERLIQKRRIHMADRLVPGRKPIKVIHPGDFAQLKADMIPAEPNPTEEPRTEVAIRPQTQAVQQFFNSLLSTLPYPPRTLSLSLKEASAYTGFSRAFLLQRIKGGELEAVRDRGYRLLRRDLDRLWG
jgi:excisionase family DNA binding protein